MPVNSGLPARFWSCLIASGRPSWLALWLVLPAACRMLGMTEGTVERLMALGRDSWPEVSVSEAAFGQFVRERLDAGELASAHGADLYLAFACLQKDPKALAAFERTYVSRIPDFIHRIDRSEATAAEVQQILRERLLVGTGTSSPKIGEYAGRGPLGSWVRVVAVRTALELQRGRKPQVAVEEGDGVSDLATGHDPELDYLRVRYATEFREAFTESLGALDAKQRTILQLYLVDGLNIERIGQVYQVHRATVARWISATRDQLYDETHRRLREKLHLDVAEFESIVRLVRSQLDVSVRRILEEGMDPDGG